MMQSFQVRVGLKSNMTGALVRIRDATETQGEQRGIPRQGGDRHWNDESTNKGTPRIACNSQKQGRGRERSSPRAFRDHGLVYTLIMDF